MGDARDSAHGEGSYRAENKKKSRTGVFLFFSKARSLLTWRLLFFVGGFALLVYVYDKPVIRTGDGFEYILMSQSLIDHASPDLRTEDIQKARPILEENGIRLSEPYHGYKKGKNGRHYSLHFWMYSLLAIPARLSLKMFGANELKGFQITNALFFILAIYSIIFRSRFPLKKRILLAALSGLSPVLFYFCRTTTEMFTWSFVLLSLVEIENREYFRGALWASVGAVQNSPIMFLAALAAFLSFRRRGFKSGFITSAAALLSFVPIGFSYAIFGLLNPIIATKPSYRLISLWRTWSFFTDLNQGLLLYVPFIVILLFPAVYRTVRFPDLNGIGLWIVAGMMIASIQLTGNWNSGGAGMMRYGVWILPVLVWLISGVLVRSRGSQALGIFAIAIHALLLLINNYPPKIVEWRPPAAYVLRTMPVLYNPEPEIFVEKQLGTEVNAWKYRDLLPVGFILPDGNITKLILDGENLSRLADFFDVDPAYSEYFLKHYAKRRDVFCLTPPRGAVKDPNGGRMIPRFDTLGSVVRTAVLNPPSQVPNKLLLRYDIQIVNKAQVTFSNLRRGNLLPLLLAIRINSVDDQHRFSKTEQRPILNGPLAPGESLTIPVEIPLPRKEGEYFVDLAPQLYQMSWTNSVRTRVLIHKYGKKYRVKLTLMTHPGGSDQFE